MDSRDVALTIISNNALQIPHVVSGNANPYKILLEVPFHSEVFGCHVND